MMRFELIPSAWKAENLPLIYTRKDRVKSVAYRNTLWQPNKNQNLS